MKSILSGLRRSGFGGSAVVSPLVEEFVPLSPPSVKETFSPDDDDVEVDNLIPIIANVKERLSTEFDIDLSSLAIRQGLNMAISQGELPSFDSFVKATGIDLS